MPARKPEECDTLLVEAINRGDLEAALALYEPNASLVQDSGDVITGLGAIREVMQGFLALKPKFTIAVKAVQSGDGSLALLRAKWSLTGTGSDGKSMVMSGNSTEVVRRQSDGMWRFVIDNPHGAD
ncbi:MAG: SgcJ/EcaC family oxidoreductase [Deltaproteobacteria bacterium]|nr:SgcJ/EcaC family oxidoreductase [Deltaproteobacteria bacterium]